VKFQTFALQAIASGMFALAVARPQKPGPGRQIQNHQDRAEPSGRKESSRQEGACGTCAGCAPDRGAPARGEEGEIARMKLQAHFQSDVLMGFCIGTGAGVIMHANPDTPYVLRVMPHGIYVGLSRRF